MSRLSTKSCDFEDLYNSVHETDVHYVDNENYLQKF